MISIIMPTLNAETFIGEALDSVEEQGFEGEYEVIVADGGSSDKTKKIAATYPFVRLLKGEDNSIYEGFNRGIEAARGQIIGFLNSDDRLAQGSLEVIHSMFSQNKPPGFISGGVTKGNPNIPGPACYNSTNLTTNGILFGIPAINARFFNRENIEKIGLFLPEIGLAADREFLLRVYKSGIEGRNVPAILYHYRVHPGSATIAGDMRARQRVWEAELRLANFLLNGSKQNEDVVRAANRTIALTMLKKRVHEGGQGRLLKAGTPIIRAAREINWFHALPALFDWRYWRTNLSGW